MLALDICPIGPDQASNERKVSVVYKDSRFPYHRAFTDELRATAIGLGLDFAVDVFTPHYGSDGDTSIVAGHDIRHALIGPGTGNSHGYERIHIDALRDLFTLTMGYLMK